MCSGMGGTPELRISSRVVDVNSLVGCATDSMGGILSLGVATGMVSVLLGVVDAKRQAVRGRMNDFA